MSLLSPRALSPRSVGLPGGLAQGPSGTGSPRRPMPNVSTISTAGEDQGKPSAIAAGNTAERPRYHRPLPPLGPSGQTPARRERQANGLSFQRDRIS